MPNKAMPYLVAGAVGVGAVATWWLWSRRSVQAGPPPTLEILTPPGTTSPSGTRIDLSARAMVDGTDISNLIQWFIVLPAPLAGFWSSGATTFIIPDFLTTQILEMQAKITDPVTGKFASRNWSVTVTVTTGLATVDPRPLRDRRQPTVLSVVNSFRRSDTGWRVWGREQGVLDEPWVYSRTRR